MIHLSEKEVCPAKQKTDENTPPGDTFAFLQPGTAYFLPIMLAFTIIRLQKSPAAYHPNNLTEADSLCGGVLSRRGYNGKMRSYCSAFCFWLPELPLSESANLFLHKFRGSTTNRLKFSNNALLS